MKKPAVLAIIILASLAVGALLVWAGLVLPLMWFRQIVFGF